MGRSTYLRSGRPFSCSKETRRPPFVRALALETVVIPPSATWSACPSRRLNYAAKSLHLSHSGDPHSSPSSSQSHLYSRCFLPLFFSDVTQRGSRLGRRRRFAVQKRKDVLIDIFFLFYPLIPKISGVGIFFAPLTAIEADFPQRISLRIVLRSPPHQSSTTSRRVGRLSSQFPPPFGSLPEWTLKHFFLLRHDNDVLIAGGDRSLEMKGGEVIFFPPLRKVKAFFTDRSEPREAKSAKGIFFSAYLFPIF